MLHDKICFSYFDQNMRVSSFELINMVHQTALTLTVLQTVIMCVYLHAYMCLLFNPNNCTYLYINFLQDTHTSSDIYYIYKQLLDMKT